MVNIIQWAKSFFGKTVPQKTENELNHNEAHKRAYENTDGENFTTIFAETLSSMAVNSCDMTIATQGGGQNKRTEFISMCLSTTWENMQNTLSQALGKGGKFLIPYVSGGRVCVSAVDQTRCAVNKTDGDGRITDMTVVAGVKQIGNKTYYRLMDYTLENGVLTIKNRVVDDTSGTVGLEVYAGWADIAQEVRISNVERMLCGFLKCPKDGKKEGGFYGVPITYGCERTVADLHECLEDIRTEYRLKRVFIGADELMIDGNGNLPAGVFKKFRVGGSLGDNKAFWEVFDPEIRDSSYYNRYKNLCEQLEREVGTAKGILSEPASFWATATEIRQGNFRTMCLVDSIRSNVEQCMNDLAYAVDVLAESYGLTPAGASGDHKVTFDWDESLRESSAETFAQLSELQSRGGCSLARLNAYVTGQTLEEAQAEIDANVKHSMTLQQILYGQQQEESEDI